MLFRNIFLVWGLFFCGLFVPRSAQAHCAGSFDWGPYTAIERGSGVMQAYSYSGTGTNSVVGADGLNRFYYPWGQVTTTQDSRTVKFWYGVNGNLPPYHTHDGYCNEHQISTPVTVSGSSIVSCQSCGSGAFGWQTMTISKRDLSVEPMKKPIIVSQGFDPDFGSSDQLTFETMVGYLNKVYPTTGEETPLTGWDSTNALNQLLNAGYDVVFVKYQSPNEDISTQGKNLLEAMEWVASKSIAGSSMYLIGPSMGGQVVRWALINLYNARKEGDASVSNIRVSGALLLDSPNLGAVIPASAIFAMREHSEFNGKAWVSYSNMAKPAAQQMLYQFARANSWSTNATAANSYATLNSGDNIRKMSLDGSIDVVAVSNGSATGLTQGVPKNSVYFDGGMAAYEALKIAGITVLSGTAGMYTKLTTGTDATANNTAFSWNITVRGSTYASAAGYSNSNWGLENAPGGYRTTFREMSNAFKKTYDNPLTIDAKVVKHAFIPTVSALGLVSRSLGNNAQIIAPVNIVGGVPQEATIFKRVYAPAYNQVHVSLTPDNMVWILGEINSATAKANSLIFTR